jgi:deoxyribodipyrimidine photolyase
MTGQTRVLLFNRECGRHRLRWRDHPGVTVVPPGELRPSGGGDYFRVFTPYRRAWREPPPRPEHPVPRRLRLPDSGAVHEPWRLPEPTRRKLDYPPRRSVAAIR